ncbi:MAG: acetolactate synthase [Clostridiales bacterium]|nr:acetolactate synthase [Clostridiales bacterium]
MQVKQLSVFVENKDGRLAKITQILAENSIDIRAVSLADTTDFGILRLIVNKPEEAAIVLRDCGVTVSLTNVIAIGMDDSPGGFAKAVKILSDAHIGLEYLYAFVGRGDGKAYVIMRVDDNEKASATLTAGGITVLSQDEVFHI